MSCFRCKGPGNAPQEWSRGGKKVPICKGCLRDLAGRQMHQCLRCWAWLDVRYDEKKEFPFCVTCFCHTFEEERERIKIEHEEEVKKLKEEEKKRF